MRAFYSLFIFIVFSFNGISQVNYTVHGIVVDAFTNEKLPLVQVSNSRLKRATHTTNEALFILELDSLSDKIDFKLLGYQPLQLTGFDCQKKDTIHLIPEAHFIDEVVILADNSLLYQLVSSCKKNRPKQKSIAKSFVEIQTFSAERQIELLQGYYNAEFDGYELVDLKTKNVRFGLQPLNTMLFTSLPVSKMFYEHKLFEANELFPGNPLMYSAKELRKKYQLFLNTKFYDDNKTIFILSFQPKNEKESLFSGKIWIDSASNKILQLNLEITNASKFPFESIYDYEKIKAVDLKITKVFDVDSNELRPELIDFDYKFEFISKQNDTIPIRSHATCHAFDFVNQFINPKFNFSKEREMSRLWSEILIIEYDSSFWKCSKDFTTSSDQDKSLLFLNDSLTISNSQIYGLNRSKEDSSSKKTLGIYRPWNGTTRIFFKDLGLDTSLQNNIQGAIPSDHYKLCVQIYLNISKLCDSIVFQTKTIFDPFKTYYHYPITMNTIVFMNIYFDLIEIQRRKLQDSLSHVAGDIQKMEQLYQVALKDVEEISERYFKDVNRGLNTEKLIFWNQMVKSEIGIDNIDLFKPK